MSKNNDNINKYSLEEVQKKNHKWWMNYDCNDKKKYDSINNPYGNITKTRIMKENPNWDIKDMQDLNIHLITTNGQDHSCSTQTNYIYKEHEYNCHGWINKENLVNGEKYTMNITQRPYIEFLCSPSTLDYLKMACDTDDLVKCGLHTVCDNKINLTKIIYNEPFTNIEVTRLECTNWRPNYEAIEHYSRLYNLKGDFACATMISRIGYGNEQDSKNKDFLKHIVDIVNKIPISQTEYVW